MHIDEIEGEWSQSVYVWVRPASGDWQDITRALGNSDRGMTEWRPAMITGFTDDTWAYNTINDPRQMRLIGGQYAYPHARFEIGGLLERDRDNAPLLTKALAP